MTPGHETGERSATITRTGPADRVRLPCGQAGFTIVELLVSLVIVSLLAAMAIYSYGGALERARTTRAIAEIRGIEKQIVIYQMDHAAYPDTLADIGWVQLDPWNSPYQYLNFDLVRRGNGNGQGGLPGRARKDRFLVPINSDYDLFSLGADRDSKQQLTARESVDDVIRANDGLFVGLASDF